MLTTSVNISNYKMFRHQFITKPLINLTPLVHDANIGLFEVIKNDLNHNKIELLFIESCKKGALLIAEELLKYDSNIDIHVNDEEAFMLACVEGYLEIVQWLWQLDQNIDIHLENEYIFRCTCINGHLKIAQWLWKLDKNIDIHANDEEIFRFACWNGHLEIVQWLWQLDQNIDIHKNNEEPFRYACSRRHLNIAQWLRQLDQNIDIHVYNDVIFISACVNNLFEVAKWLLTLCHYYFVEIRNGKIIKWKIKDENDIILELVQNNKYNEAITKLNIKSMSTKNIHECIVCYDEPIEIIELPCCHTLCLESIVRFNVRNKITIKKCFYCQKRYQWNQCVSLCC